jgi:hypothetical protein
LKSVFLKYSFNGIVYWCWDMPFVFLILQSEHPPADLRLMDMLLAMRALSGANSTWIGLGRIREWQLLVNWRKFYPPRIHIRSVFVMMIDKRRDLLKIRVELSGISPPVWREILVPARYSFWDLHVAI